MIRPDNRYTTIFAEFPDLRRQLRELHPIFYLFYLPFLSSWLAGRTIQETATMTGIMPETIISFINKKIAGNAGCLDQCDIKRDKLPPGFFDSTLQKMEDLEKRVKSRHPDRLVYLDVSELPAPEPLMKIREALSMSPPPVMVRAFHRKIPVHLPGYLKGKPYRVFAEETAEDEVVIYVFNPEEIEDM